MHFGLMFFAGTEADGHADKYRLVIEGARFADRHGFRAVWVPERHFVEFGALYPSPSVLHAALARETTAVRLRAGSVVLPLNNPLRVAEDWAMVDNLSGGRVDLSFASGWRPEDFALAPESYDERHEVMFGGIETVKRLWRGESVAATAGDGSPIDVRTRPSPIQPELPVWVTAAGNPETFRRAGSIGANLLTHLLDQGIDQVADKIAVYRRARAENGHDPHRGSVAMMLHTFIGADVQTVRAQTQGPFCAFLKTLTPMIHGLARSRNSEIDVDLLSEAEIDAFARFLFDRFFSTRALLGTPESCLPLIRDLENIGVDEIACLLDFGVDADLMLQSLPHLSRLEELCHAEPERPVSVLATTERLSDIQRRCNEELPDAIAGGIVKLWRTDGEALASIRLDGCRGRSAGEAEARGRMLEAALPVLLSTLPAGHRQWPSDGVPPLAGVARLRHYGSPSDELWSHARLRPDALAAGTIEGDLRLYDAAGRLVTEATGVRFTSSAHELAYSGASVAGVPPDWLYELDWEVSVAVAPSPRPCRWLLFEDAGGWGRRIADHLATRGERVLRVAAGERSEDPVGGRCVIDPDRPGELERVLRMALAGDTVPLRVLYLWMLDATPAEETTFASLRDDVASGAGRALSLIQAMIPLAGSTEMRIWLVTCDAQPVPSSPRPLQLAQATLWGLGKTCAQEHSELWGGMIDLDSQADRGEAVRELVQETDEGDGEDQVVFRGAKRFVGRLRRARLGARRELEIRGDASYLISGGLSGLGLECACWLARSGARSLVLLGRTPLPPRSQWQGPHELEPEIAQRIAGIERLEQLGATVHHPAVDVADADRLRRLLSELESAGHPPVRGVIHAASVWKGPQGETLVRPLASSKREDLTQVFAPKVLGGWLLQHLLAESELDFFVSFSTGASLAGSAGQGNYAAAGAYLDALAHELRARGRAALTINWGSVSGIGFGATPEGRRVHDFWEQRGVGRITHTQVLDALATLIGRDVAQIGVLRLDWLKIAQAYPQLAERPWARRLVPRAGRAQPPRPPTSGNRIDLGALVGSRGSEDACRVAVDAIKEEVGSVLRLPTGEIGTDVELTQLGLDSLMAIELKSRIEARLDVALPIASFLEDATIPQLASRLIDTALAESSSAHQPAAPLEWEEGEL